MTPAADTGNGSSITLPRWFLWFITGASSIFLALFVPWATWMTTTLITMRVQMDTALEVKAQITVVEGMLQQHIVNENAHSLTDIRRRLFDMEARVERMRWGDDKK